MDSSQKSCRVCGMVYHGTDMLEHELTCLQKSQEKLNTEPTESPDIPVHSNEKENPGNPKKYQNQIKGSTSEHEEQEVSIRSSNSITSESSPYPPILSGISQDETEDLEFHNVRFDSGPPIKKSVSFNLTPSMSYDRKKPKDLFPPTKKYRYYPITCEYCRKQFQPNKLKAHQKKYHFKESDSSQRTQSAAMRKGYHDPGPESSKRRKSFGGIPRRLQVCYICGRMYGSKSLKIHEPNCLDKWRIQNNQLPPHKRAREPVKPEVIKQGVTSDRSYSLPNFDPAAEAAFRSHLRTLIPCSYCSRTFSPDRVMRHESCCINRPRTRECITPSGGEIGR